MSKNKPIFIHLEYLVVEKGFTNYADHLRKPAL